MEFPDCVRVKEKNTIKVLKSRKYKENIFMSRKFVIVLRYVLNLSQIPYKRNKKIFL